MKEVLGQIQQRILAVGVSIDTLYPLPEQIALFENMENATFGCYAKQQGEQPNDLLRYVFGGDPSIEG